MHVTLLCNAVVGNVKSTCSQR